MPHVPERKMLSFQTALAEYLLHSFCGGARAKTLSTTETPVSQSVRIGAFGQVAAVGVEGRYVLPRNVMSAHRAGLPPLVTWIPYHDSLPSCVKVFRSTVTSAMSPWSGPIIRK